MAMSPRPPFSSAKYSSQTARSRADIALPMVPGISTTMGRGVLTERLARSAERQRGSSCGASASEAKPASLPSSRASASASQAIDLRLLK